MNVTVTRAHALTPRLVEVEAKGPRGGEYHFALYYARDRQIQMVVETNPSTTVCHSGTRLFDVPTNVIRSAGASLEARS